MYPGRATSGYIFVDVHVLLDTVHVARPGYMLTVSQCHNYYSFMSRSASIALYPATDGRQNGDNSFCPFCRRYKTDVDGDKWIQVYTTCIRQHVSWCKRGLIKISAAASNRAAYSSGALCRLTFASTFDAIPQCLRYIGHVGRTENSAGVNAAQIRQLVTRPPRGHQVHRYKFLFSQDQQSVWIIVVCQNSINNIYLFIYSYLIIYSQSSEKAWFFTNSWCIWPVPILYTASIISIYLPIN